MKVCSICGAAFEECAAQSPFVEAGAWLAGELWHDAGELCPRCLENRGELAMMYLPECSR